VAVEIRLADPRDEAALASLDRGTWTTASSPAPPPGPEWTFFGGQTRPEDVLVAVVDGEVGGYVRLGRATDLDASDHVCTINGIAVAIQHRQSGLGRKLVHAAVDEARARGARRLTLRVLAPNDAARHLYESAGFVVEGVQRYEFFLDGRYVDDVLMALDLTRK
jgi:ribosomal protein S18 acetylase RimI-like enzyme